MCWCGWGPSKRNAENKHTDPKSLSTGLYLPTINFLWHTMCRVISIHGTNNRDQSNNGQKYAASAHSLCAAILVRINSDSLQQCDKINCKLDSQHRSQAEIHKPLLEHHRTWSAVWCTVTRWLDWHTWTSTSAWQPSSHSQRMLLSDNNPQHHCIK